MIRLLTSTAIALVLFGLPAQANEDAAMKKQSAMQDGQQTTSAATDQAESKMTQGSAEELRTAEDYREVSKMFDEFDANSDGGITREEWTSREKQMTWAPNFKDINDAGTSEMKPDDKLTQAEWDKFFEQRIAQAETNTSQ